MIAGMRPFHLAAALAGVVLLFVLRGGPGDLDSPELVAAVRDLGQLHPPGHPVYLGWSLPFTLLPIGPLPFRMALASAAAVALAAGVLAELAVLWLYRPDAPPGERLGPARAVVCTLFGAMAALVPGVAEQAVRPEVYGLHLLLVSAATYLMLRLCRSPDDRAMTLALGLVCGLALANHHFLTVLALAPAAAWTLLRPAGRRVRRTALATAGVLVGLLPYLVLLARDPAASSVVWLDTRSLAGFLDMVTARPFQASLGETGRVDVLGNTALAFGMLLRFTGPAPFALGLVGLGLLAWKRPAGWGRVATVLAGALVAKVFMFADPENPDDRGYLAVAFALWTCFGALTLAKFLDLAGDLPSSGRRLATALALALLAGTVGERAAATVGVATDAEPRSLPVVRAALDDVPARSLALVHYFQTHFLLQYAAVVEGRRPDLIEVQAALGGRSGPGTAPGGVLARRHVELAGLWEASREHDGLPLRWLLEATRRRPVVIEPEASTPALPVEQMSFTAFLARLHAAPIPPLCREGALARTFGALAAAPRATGTRALIAFSLLEHVAFHLRRGNVACAAEATELVRAAIGPTPMLERLEARVERLRGLAGPSGHVQPSPYRGMTEP